MLQRVPDWPDRLQAEIVRFESQPFKWGSTDCACFAGACVEAITGADVLGSYRGTYEGRLGAFARLRHRQHATVTEAAQAAFWAVGAPEIPPAVAKVGDVGITADQILCVRVPSGFIARALSGSFFGVEAVHAWRVG